MIFILEESEVKFDIVMAPIVYSGSDGNVMSGYVSIQCYAIANSQLTERKIKSESS